MEDSEDSDVDEAEWRGESEGETTVEVSESVADEVAVLLSAGFVGLAAPEALVVAMAYVSVRETVGCCWWSVRLVRPN